MKTSFYYLIQKPKNNTNKSPLVFLLHGFGSNEQDLFSFSPHLSQDATIISLRAPIMLYPNSYAWYNIFFSGSVKRYDKEAAKFIRDKIINEMDYFINKYNCDPNRITLIGFSQGAILAHAIAQNSNIKNLIALSGYVDKELISFKKTNNLSIYISHGKYDEVIPFEESLKTNKLLDDNNLKYEFKEFDQGHGVNSQNLKSFLGWIKDKY